MSDHAHTLYSTTVDTVLELLQAFSEIDDKLAGVDRALVPVPRCIVELVTRGGKYTVTLRLL